MLLTTLSFFCLPAVMTLTSGLGTTNAVIAPRCRCIARKHLPLSNRTDHSQSTPLVDPPSIHMACTYKAAVGRAEGEGEGRGNATPKVRITMLRIVQHSPQTRRDSRSLHTPSTFPNLATPQTDHAGGSMTVADGHGGWEMSFSPPGSVRPPSHRPMYRVCTNL